MFLLLSDDSAGSLMIRLPQENHIPLCTPVTVETERLEAEETGHRGEGARGARVRHWVLCPGTLREILLLSLKWETRIKGSLRR